ncbi:MAG: hypothetical protein NW226_10275 [Microscillaceae bacterium]|nr:hypothetical protein [Microscillaceae bacterium]
MQQLILNIKDQSKLEFLLELLKRMEFVEIVDQDNPDFDTDTFLKDIYQAREDSGKSLAEKLNNILDI